MQTREHTLYVVRHGENPANINREFSYKLIDYSLTPKGVRQAEETAVFFRDKDIHEVYSSPLKRALETAEIIAAPLGLPVVIREEFRENNVGDLEKEPPTDENWALHDRIIADWYAGRHDSTFPGGEDFHTLVGRVRAGIIGVLG
jgi:broad specificity phosphatase PhoE